MSFFKRLISVFNISAPEDNRSPERKLVDSYDFDKPFENPQNKHQHRFNYLLDNEKAIKDSFERRIEAFAEQKRIISKRTLTYIELHNQAIEAVQNLKNLRVKSEVEKNNRIDSFAKDMGKHIENLQNDAILAEEPEIQRYLINEGLEAITKVKNDIEDRDRVFNKLDDKIEAYPNSLVFQHPLISKVKGRENTYKVLPTDQFISITVGYFSKQKEETLSFGLTGKNVYEEEPIGGGSLFYNGYSRSFQEELGWDKVSFDNEISNIFQDALKEVGFKENNDNGFDRQFNFD